MYQALSHGVQPVAVKVFPLTASAEQHAEFQREVVLLKSCRDGNIVQVSHQALLAHAMQCPFCHVPWVTTTAVHDAVNLSQ